MTSQKWVCLGAFAGAHGVKGDFKIKTFTENERDIAAYGSVFTKDGTRSFKLNIIKVLSANTVLARSPDIATREEAISLSSTKLYIDRNLLPDTDDEDEFYLEDLVGLNVVDSQNNPRGKISAIHNFGAGDIIELRNVPNRKGSILLSFTKENFPTIDLDNNQISIDDIALIEDTTPKPE